MKSIGKVTREANSDFLVCSCRKRTNTSRAGFLDENRSSAMRRVRKKKKKEHEEEAEIKFGRNDVPVENNRQNDLITRGFP